MEQLPRRQSETWPQTTKMGGIVRCSTCYRACDHNMRTQCKQHRACEYLQHGPCLASRLRAAGYSAYSMQCLSTYTMMIEVQFSFFHVSYSFSFTCRIFYHTTQNNSKLLLPRRAGRLAGAAPLPANGPLDGWRVKRHFPPTARWTVGGWRCPITALSDYRELWSICIYIRI